MMIDDHHGQNKISVDDLTNKWQEFDQNIDIFRNIFVAYTKTLFLSLYLPKNDQKINFEHEEKNLVRVFKALRVV